MTDNTSSLNDTRALAEALADVLTERGLVARSGDLQAARVLDAGEVALLLGRDRQWVYDHAIELGAFRYGNGPKARLGFDLADVERWKREHRLSRQPPRRMPPPRPKRQNEASPGARLIAYEPLD
jgi:hypothetical protein